MTSTQRPIVRESSEAFADDDLIVTGEAVTLDVRPAGFMLRAASSLIDAVLMWIVFLVLLFAVFFPMIGLWERFGDSPLADEAILYALLISITVFSFVVVPMLVEWFTRGKSLGRLAMGLRIVRDDGGGTTLRHAFIRALAGFFEFVVLSGATAVIVGLLHPRSKRLGDVLAGSYAQNERAPRLEPLAWPLPPGLERWAAVADVARIPDRLSRRMRDYLRQAPRLEPAMRQRHAGILAREARHFVHPIPDVDADTFLRAVAAVRRDREARALELRALRGRSVADQLQALPHGFPQRG
ncbi:MAG: RDD family protein [Pseudoclavibacter sp.]|nr:RDD family protein [Pseudoclavibacter sp.]